MKVPVKIKREEGDFKKERRKYVAKLEEMIIQETKEDMREEKCEMFQSASHNEDNNR